MWGRKRQSNGQLELLSPFPLVVAPVLGPGSNLFLFYFLIYSPNIVYFKNETIAKEEFFFNNIVF